MLLACVFCFHGAFQIILQRYSKYTAPPEPFVFCFSRNEGALKTVLTRFSPSLIIQVLAYMRQGTRYHRKHRCAYSLLPSILHHEFLFCF